MMIMMIWWIIDQIFGVDIVPLFNAFIQVEYLNSGVYEIWPLHRSMVWCKAYVDILNRLGVDQECDRQTDRQTDELKSS